MVIENSTITGNSAGPNGSWAAASTSVVARSANTIVANNLGDTDVPDDVSRGGGTLNASFSLIPTPPPAGTINGADSGNVTGDPQITLNPDGTYTLAQTSPLINAGDPDATGLPPQTRWATRARQRRAGGHRPREFPVSRTGTGSGSGADADSDADAHPAWIAPGGRGGRLPAASCPCPTARDGR